MNLLVPDNVENYPQLVGAVSPLSHPRARVGERSDPAGVESGEQAPLSRGFAARACTPQT